MITCSMIFYHFFYVLWKYGLNLGLFSFCFEEAQAAIIEYDADLLNESYYHLNFGIII